MRVIIGFFLVTLLMAAGTVQGAGKIRGDGKLTLYSYHTDDVLEVTFRTAKGYDRSALEKIYRLMRSRGDDAVYPISTDLIDLLDAIQDRFGAETVEIISGYRSSEFNEDLIVNGRGAASESLHTKGMAADIHIDEITERAVWEYAKSIGRGGAGYYPRHNFVHVDVGPARIWRDPDPKRRILTGVDLNPNPDWTALTDRNIYRQGEPVAFTVSKRTGMSSGDIAIWYDRFSKGKWSKHKLIEKSVKSNLYEWKPGKIPFGKYRFVVFVSRDKKTPPVYSNEFYIKRQ